MSGLTHDLFDRGSLSPRENGGVRVFPPQISLILNALGGGEQIWVDGRRADRGADLTHRFADGVEEGMAGVLHQMPAIGDLHRLRQRLGGGQRISAATVTRDNGDLWLAREPRLRGRWLLSGRRQIGRRRSRSQMIVP